MTAKNHPVKGAGSLNSSEPVFLALGKFRRPHGLNGEIAMEIYTDFPERLVPGTQLFVGEDHHQVNLRKIRQHQQLLLVTLDGFDTREVVEEFKNQIVYVPASDRPQLEEGEFYHHELIGLKVLDDTGQYLGWIVEILETGANDVFVVRSDHRADLLLPYLNDLVIKVDLDQGEYHTRLIPGLLSED